MRFGFLSVIFIISALVSPAVVPRFTPVELPGIRWTWEPLHESRLEEARRLGLNPGLIQGKGKAEAVARAHLAAAKAELERPPTWPPPNEYRTGAPRTVLRLSPPDAPPRAVVVLRGAGTCPCPLYLLERTPAVWRQTDLGTAEAAEIRDVSGDGRPEIITSAIHGSGHFLSVRVWAWDQTRLWRAFAFNGPGDSGPVGLDDDQLWIDLPTGRGLFTELPSTHGPFVKERRFYRWVGDTYRQERSEPLATPFYHLNQYLYFAGQGDWKRAAQHAEPDASIDRDLVASLGHGPLNGGGLQDDWFINARQYFRQGEADYFVDFGPTGRVLRIGAGVPGQREEIGRAAPGLARATSQPLSVNICMHDTIGTLAESPEGTGGRWRMAEKAGPAWGPTFDPRRSFLRPSTAPIGTWRTGCWTESQS